MSQITFSPSNHNKKIIHFYVSIFCFVSSGQVCKSLIIVIWPQKKPAVEQSAAEARWWRGMMSWCAATVCSVHWRMGSWVVKNPVISMPQSLSGGPKLPFRQQLRLWWVSCLLISANLIYNPKNYSFLFRQITIYLKTFFQGEGLLLVPSAPVEGSPLRPVSSSSPALWPDQGEDGERWTK